MGDCSASTTSKQCNVAAALEFACEKPHLHFNVVEPGFNPGTALGRPTNVFLRFLMKYAFTIFAPYIKYWSTPKQAARVISQVLFNEPGKTCIYYDEKGQPMQAFPHLCPHQRSHKRG